MSLSQQNRMRHSTQIVRCVQVGSQVDEIISEELYENEKNDDKPLFLLPLLFLESPLATLCQQISAHGIALGMCQNRATGGFTQHTPLVLSQRSACMH